MDTRLIKLRALFQNEHTVTLTASGKRIADIVDPLLEDGKNLVKIATSAATLGYGFASRAPGASALNAPGLETNGGYVYVRPHITDDLSDHLETFVIQGATTTHTISLNAAAGGIIDTWHVEKPSASIDSQIINRYAGWTRSIQAGMTWVDPLAGELTRHNPVQGGNRFSESGNSAYLAHGGYLTSAISRKGNVIRSEFIPVEQDPDGYASVPGVTSNHYGSSTRPVIWRDMEWSQELHVNWKDHENLHLLRTTFHFPFDVTTYYFDLERYHVFCLDAGEFSQVQYYDALSDTADVLSDGTVTDPNYVAEFRRYLMDSRVIWGDDEGATTASVVPNKGGVAATGATGTDMAVLIGNRLETCNFKSDPYAFEGLPRGNVLGWMQNRDDSDGQDEKNVVMLSHAAMLSGRFHGYSAQRKVRAGTYRLETFIATDTFDDCQTLFGSVP